jgi:hypothetical protein
MRSGSRVLFPVIGLAITAVLAWSFLAAVQAAPAKLRIDRVQLASALLGPVRSAFYPGEAVVIRFELIGAGLTKGGELSLETGITIKDGKGALVADVPVAAGIRTPNLFQADRIPCFFSIPPQVFSKPGTYKVTLHANDKTSPVPRTVRHSLEVTFVEKAFYLGNRRITLDPQGAYETAGPFRVGQTLFFCQHVVGYGMKEGKVHLQLDLEVRDDAGKVIGSKENHHTLQSAVTPVPPFLLMSAFMNLTRPGSYKIHIAITDHILKKKDVAVYDITVLENTAK